MLTPGTVIRVPVEFKQGEPKYLVIVDLDSDAHCLVINTYINPLFGGALAEPSIVPIDVASHPFMHHDCHIDCNEVKLLSLDGIHAEISADADCLKGIVSDTVRDAIIVAMQISPFLTPNEKERYITALA